MHHISCQDSHLIFWRHDETDHGRAIASSFLQGFDKLHHRVKHVTGAMARSSQAAIKAVSLHSYPLDLPYLHLRLAALLALVTHLDRYNSRERERDHSNCHWLLSTSLTGRTDANNMDNVPAQTV